MKKLLVVLVICVLLMQVSAGTVSAEEISYDFSGVYEGLSDDAVRHLNELGVNSADAQSLSALSFEGIMAQIGSMAAESAASPLRGLITVIALLLICSMLSAYKNTLSGEISTAMNTVCALCISCAVVIPAVSVIQSAEGVVTGCANLFLAYIPIVTVMMATAGKPLASASYYASMIAAGEGVARLSSDIILPFLNMFLGLAITSGVSQHINLNGLIAMLSKTVKWFLGLMMTVFTTVISFRQMLSSSLDSVGGKVARFAIGSFVPIVGSALSDAYSTVQSSLSVLKSGLGVFVILAVAVTFLPLVLQAVLWSLTLWTGRAVAEVMGLYQSARLLGGLSAVFSALLAVLLCMMAVFIISTAAAFSIGGAA